MPRLNYRRSPASPRSSSLTLVTTHRLEDWGLRLLRCGWVVVIVFPYISDWVTLADVCPGPRWVARSLCEGTGGVSNPCGISST
jgi:hypothetical protein